MAESEIAYGLLLVEQCKASQMLLVDFTKFIICERDRFLEAVFPHAKGAFDGGGKKCQKGVRNGVEVGCVVADTFGGLFALVEPLLSE